MDTSIALALAGVSLAVSVAFTLVGGGTFIYITVKVIRTSDEFAQKASTVAVTNLMNVLSQNLQKNMDVVLPRIKDIEDQMDIVVLPRIRDIEDQMNAVLNRIETIEGQI